MQLKAQQIITFQKERFKDYNMNLQHKETRANECTTTKHSRCMSMLERSGCLKMRIETDGGLLHQQSFSHQQRLRSRDDNLSQSFSEDISTPSMFTFTRLKIKRCLKATSMTVTNFYPSTILHDRSLGGDC